MDCLTDADVQAVVDNEATEPVRTHAASCDRCRDRVNDRRLLMSEVMSLVDREGDVPPGVESRLREAVNAGRAVRGATVLRGTSSNGGWRRAGLVSAAATAAVVALVVFGVLPRVGAPTSLSAAEILGRSLQALTAATGIERLEYELIVSGVAD
jgi:anti-sigma-K factor RskA